MVKIKSRSENPRKPSQAITSAAAAAQLTTVTLQVHRLLLPLTTKSPESLNVAVVSVLKSISLIFARRI
ncbi:conserved hypothetical protein [Ricinus communis]|uniref:Uncharacterized protein n=1 Tax=Ricinus communis TaxID=3988 RepID=B9T2C9_RICCO|nr:conserved hypothetical protein [Ricinus communis]